MDTNTTANPQPVQQAVSPTSTAPKKKSNALVKLGCFGCGLVVLIAIIIGFGYVYFNYLAPQAKYSSNNGVEEVNLAYKDLVTQAIKAVDLSKLNKENPVDILNTPEIYKLSKQNQKFNKLAANTNIDISGKTVEIALNTKFKMNNSSSYYSSSTNPNYSGELNADVFFEEPAYNKSKYDLSTSEAQKKFVDNLTKEDLEAIIPKIKLNGDLTLDVSGENIKGKVDFYFLDKTIFFKLYNLTIPSSTDKSLKNQLTLIEDKVIKVDLSKYYDSYLDTLVQAIKESYKNQKIYTEEDLKNEANKFLKNALKNAKQEDIDLMRKVGNQILQVVSDEVNKTDLMTSIKTVAPIKDGTSSQCSQGTLNASGLIDAVSDGSKKVFDILEKENKTTQSKSDFVKQVDQSVSEFKKQLSDSQFNMNFRTCYDNKMNTLSGLGFDIKLITTSYYSSSDLSLNMDYLVVNYDAKVKIEAPAEDLDFTDEFNKTVDQSTKSAKPYTPTINNPKDYTPTPETFDSSSSSEDSSSSMDDLGL